MKFPYGLSDFKQIVTQDFFYQDRTHFIPILENIGNYLLFIRPRRFGKSLLLSMLEHYYDVARKDEFETIFGHLKIGENPTPLRNGFFILKWDFSCVDPSGTAQDIKKALHGHVNRSIQLFYETYKSFLTHNIDIDLNDALISLQSLIGIVRQTDYPIYLLIDEYDNFANEVMMNVQEGRNNYEALVFESGPLKTLFKVVKSLSQSTGIAKSFITGVSPVVMSDITSGYNIAENIYLKPKFNTLCGFEESEIRETLIHLVSNCHLPTEEANHALDMMRTWYNGYKFSLNAKEYVYNPTLSLYFMKAFQEECSYPHEMLDDNLATDQAKLTYVSHIHTGKSILLNLMKDNHQITIPKLINRFGIQEMLSDETKDQAFLASFLYYFGVLTIHSLTDMQEITLKVPNLVMKGLYVERIQRMLLPDPFDQDDGKRAAKALYSQGNIKPLCNFIEQRYFKVFHNRDYRWANELTVKTAFLTLLYNDILYVMDSETEISRRYADLTMILRPDMRHVKAYDILIEFKFVSLKDAGMTGEQAVSLSSEELQAIPPMKSKMQAAKVQIQQYGDELQQKYGNLKLRRYAVVSLGYERVWGEEMG